jgi:hypothetical protein
MKKLILVLVLLFISASAFGMGEKPKGKPTKGTHKAIKVAKEQDQQPPPEGKAGLNNGKNEADSLSEELQQKINDLYFWGLYPYKNIKDLGEPKKVDVKWIEGGHPPGEKFEFITKYYDGVTFSGGMNYAKNQLMVNKLVIFSGKYEIKWGIRVGMTREEVESILGKPTLDAVEPKDGALEQNETKVAYLQRGEGYSGLPVYFYYKDSILTKVEWDIGVD